MKENINPIKENDNMMPYMKNMGMMQQPNPMMMPQQSNPMMAMPQSNQMMMMMPQQICPMMQQNLQMMTMQENQLEAMYPKTYHIINPVVQHYCDMMDMKYGVMNNPTKEQLDEACENICKDVEGEVDKAVGDEMKEGQRQLGFGGRRILRDLAGILLLRELLRRRRFFGFFGMPFFGGF